MVSKATKTIFSQSQVSVRVFIEEFTDGSAKAVRAGLRDLEADTGWEINELVEDAGEDRSYVVGMDMLTGQVHLPFNLLQGVIDPMEESYDTTIPDYNIIVSSSPGIIDKDVRPGIKHRILVGEVDEEMMPDLTEAHMINEQESVTHEKGKSVASREGIQNPAYMSVASRKNIRQAIKDAVGEVINLGG